MLSIDLRPIYGPYGAMVYEDGEDGKAICHFCGGAYTQVGTHSGQAHGISSADYREICGLSQRYSLSSKGWMRRQSQMMKEKYEAGLVALPLPEDVHSLAVAGTRAKVRGRKQRESQRRAATSAHKEYWSDLSNKQPSPRKRKHTEGQTCPICGVLFTPIKYSKPSTTGRVLVSHRNRGETCSEQCKLELAARTNRSVGEDGKLYFTSESARTYGDRRRRRATSL